MPVFSATKAEAVYEELRDRILDGSLQPGVALDQKSLAAEYLISTTPIREALRRLESEQLVIVKAHHGPRVSSLSVQELHYLFAVRLELDPLAGGLAAQAATESERAVVRNLLERTTETPGHRISINREFHRAIYQACGNPVLIHILDSLWNRCDRYRFLLADADQLHSEQELQGHADMAQALEARDSAALESLLHAHIENSYKKLSGLAEAFTASNLR
jgi:DNA-binding GntR family transcriptional regulator